MLPIRPVASFVTLVATLLVVPIRSAAQTTAGSQAAEAAAASRASNHDELGGAATVRDATRNAFGYPAPAMTAAERRAFVVGNSFFKQNWISAPSSTPGRDGLGPLFNARSCSTCHLRDGRSCPPAADDIERGGLLIRIGVRVPAGPDVAHPRYGDQVQEFSIPGMTAEARVTTSLEAITGVFADGSPFERILPRYSLADLGYGPLDEGAVISPRTAPHLIGLGLLEAVPAARILALADPDDRDRDGISGRPNMLRLGDHPVLGRFGWKATQPTVRLQTAAAFVNDIGITSPAFREDALSEVQRGDHAGTEQGDGSPDIDDLKLDRVSFYTSTLAVPAQRNAGAPHVVRGRRLFDSFRCASCHAPEMVTGDDAIIASHRRQVIRPYTDLLLHDMGDDLADEKHDGCAQPNEWRTPPLWGIGLFETVNGHSRYLHDGRARNLTEAILWHGGEARESAERFRTAPRDERDALIAFLESL